MLSSTFYTLPILEEGVCKVVLDWLFPFFPCTVWLDIFWAWKCLVLETKALLALVEPELLTGMSDPRVVNCKVELGNVGAIPFGCCNWNVLAFYYPTALCLRPPEIALFERRIIAEDCY